MATSAGGAGMVCCARENPGMQSISKKSHSRRFIVVEPPQETEKMTRIVARRAEPHDPLFRAVEMGQGGIFILISKAAPSLFVLAYFSHSPRRARVSHDTGNESPFFRLTGT